MDTYTQLFSPKLLDSNILLFGVSIFVTASSVYHLYLLNKMFQSQQETLRENQQHQYRIYQDLVSIISNNNSLPNSSVFPSERKPEILQLLPEENKDTHKEKKKSNFESNNNSSQLKGCGFLSELKEVLKSRETP